MYTDFRLYSCRTVGTLLSGDTAEWKGGAMPRTPSLDQAVTRLTREIERVNMQCDQQIRITKRLVQRLQQMAAQVDAKIPDLAHTGFDFLDNDLDAGFTLVRIAAEAAPNSDRRIRNRQAAQRALETVQHFAGKWTLTEAERHELSNRITRLRKEVDALTGPN